MRKAPNRINDNIRANPYPPEKTMSIKQALKHLGEI